MKHFKLREDLSIEVEGRTLYRIEALTDIPSKGVKKGDIGGWIEKLDNLHDTAWVYDDATVYKNARVYGNAEVRCNALVADDATVYDNAIISGDAKVRDNAKVYENAAVYFSARVWENAEIYGYARVYDSAIVGGNAIVCGHTTVNGNSNVYKGIIEFPYDCKNIMGEKYNITIMPKYIQIAYYLYAKNTWWNLTDDRISELFGSAGVAWWKKWKPILKSICK